MPAEEVETHPVCRPQAPGPSRAEEVVVNRHLRTHRSTRRPIRGQAGRARLTAVAAISAAALTLTGCSVDNTNTTKPGGQTSGASSSGEESGGGNSSANKTVTLLTHASWVMDDKLAAEFTKRTGYTLKVQKSGDAGELANKVVLSKGNPAGDVVFGIDNTFASRVTKAGAIADYESGQRPASASTYDLPAGQGKGQFNPIDYGHVCVNVDDAWFAKHGKIKPNSLDDLIKPEYQGLMVAPGAASSSPGMAFLLATIAKYGENGWQQYWSKLMANDLKLDAGWDDAWNVDYTGAGKGKRPIVVSYDSSPTATLDKSGKTTTSILADTCFRSVEYAGVLKGAKNEAGAKAFIDFMYGSQFQQALPTSMYVFPVDSKTALPKEWSANVQKVTQPLNVDPNTIDAKRQEWLTQWQDVTSK